MCRRGVFPPFALITAAGLLCIAACRPNAPPNPNDTDGDGWFDDYERRVGTDPFSREIDSDGDGLPDLLEMRLGTNPHDRDTNRDGVADGDEDTDGDNLSNAMELRLRLDPRDNDSDDNGARDGDEDADGDELTNENEIDREHTDPLNPDSDNDGARDDKEVYRPDLDPNNPDSDGDGVIDGKDPFNTPANARDVLLVKRAGWECVSGSWHFREWHSYVRYFLNPQTGAVVNQQILSDILFSDTPSEAPCDRPPPEVQP